MNIAWIKNYVQQFSARIANYVIISTSTSKGLKDSVEGREVGQNGKKYSLSVRRIQNFGHRSVPPAKSEGIVVRVNAGRRSLALIATENLDYGRTDLKEGESQHYCKVKNTEVFLNENGEVRISMKGEATLFIDKDGNVKIDSKATKDVVVNGGTLKVARVTDTCKIQSPSFLATWMSQVEGYINGQVAGTVVPLSAGFLVAPGIEISSTLNGADRFKA